MKKVKYLSLLVLSLLLILTACSFLPASSANVDEQIAQTVAAQVAATAAMEQAQREIFSGQTATADAEVSMAEATAAAETSIADAVSEALTAAAPPPTDTPIPATITPETPPTPTATETPIFTNTPKPSPTQCYHVLDLWCLSHEGCHSMTILNKTNSNATVRIWLYDGSLDYTLYSPPGIRCSMVLKPGKYNYVFDYCGEHSEGSHALNGRWYIDLKCP